MKITEANEKSVWIEQTEYEIDQSDFVIDESALDAELCTIGKLLLDYGHVEALAKLEVGQAETACEYLWAIMYNKAQGTLSGSGTRGPTVDQISNHVMASEEYQNACKYKNHAVEQHARARWAVLALQQKSEALRTLAYRENRQMKSEGY